LKNKTQHTNEINLNSNNIHTQHKQIKPHPKTYPPSLLLRIGEANDVKTTTQQKNKKDILKTNPTKIKQTRTPNNNEEKTFPKVLTQT
jgi:hypothetical protein